MTLSADLEAGFLAAPPTRDEAMSGYGALLRRLTDRERFPALHAVLDAGIFDVADDPDNEFAFGLECVLDGVAVLIRFGGPRSARSTGRSLIEVTLAAACGAVAYSAPCWCADAPMGTETSD